MRAAIYCRVSSTQQAKEGDSISAQLDALRKYIRKYSYECVGEFVDDGISGTKYDRDEFQKMLDMVEAGKVDIILTTKMDRLHRSLRNFLNMQDVLDRNGCHWKAIWEPSYDTTTPQGRMIVNTMMNLAQFEAEQTSQRIKQVFEYKRSKREVTSGSAPVGLSIVNKHLVPNEDADDVRRAFEIYDRTGNLSKTVEMTVETKLPKMPCSMRYMLSNRLYIGENHGYTDYCEPIVDRELFDRVQIALKRNIKRSQKNVYLFSGMFYCAECGSKMTALYRGEGNSPAYRCRAHYERKVNKCVNTRSISDKTLEKKLLDMLPNVIIEQVEMREKKTTRAVSYERQKAALEKKIERLKILFINEEIGLDEYRADKGKLLDQIAELAPVERPEPSQAILQLEGLNIREVYEILSIEERRMFWRGIIKEIRMDKSRNLFFDFNV